MLSYLSKEFEKILNQKLMISYLDSNKNYSAIANIGDVWMNVIHNFGDSRTVSLDIIKAFDRV